MHRSAGSSPPVRGTPCPLPSRRRFPRFIPACAGNTLHPPPLARLRVVHPRLCGEHMPAFSSNARRAGSSPPVRGTLLVHKSKVWRYRFIPACAGNTGVVVSLTLFSPVHPRLCGEHDATGSLPITLNGSSPPVRGTLYRQDGIVRMIRFIPACAGNTSASLDVQRLPTVHPRLCGEHIIWPIQSRCRNGSSPPVRGTQQTLAPLFASPRFIPACAGNTRTWRR